ncbi:MAG: Holliday junction branch migration protein RuvA [Planctomycetes bacterium]|nr:Holliday junction branch migration protein RuvA [Planctomycetota bacterium]
MLDHIAGQLVRKDITEVVVRAGGIGYRLSIPVSTYEKLPSEGDVLLYSHLAVREKDVRLYGFASEGERVLFRVLLGARGIGPAGALAIMSGSSPEEFARAVVEEDYEALSRIRGVGKKTARRIVAEIKEDIIAFKERFLAGAPSADTAMRDAVMALVSLGLPRNIARKRVERARKEHAGADVETLVRLVLSESVG